MKKIGKRAVPTLWPYKKEADISHLMTYNERKRTLTISTTTQQGNIQVMSFKFYYYQPLAKLLICFAYFFAQEIVLIL